MENNNTHKRRVRYSGTHPKKYHEKYKELQPEKYKETVEQMKNSLTEEQKSVFELLRKCRQTIADEDIIRQNYDVFSDKELLLMCNMEELTEKKILENEEIKKERKEKYAKRLMNGYKGMAPTV